MDSATCTIHDNTGVACTLGPGGFQLRDEFVNWCALGKAQFGNTVQTGERNFLAFSDQYIPIGAWMVTPPFNTAFDSWLCYVTSDRERCCWDDDHGEHNE